MNYIRYRQPQVWSPFNRLASFRHLLDTAFTTPGFGPSESWSPALDLYEDSDKFTARLEVAGLRREDFDVSLDDNVLTIAGARQPSADAGRQVAFTRSLKLPTAVKAEEIRAVYQDGVLTLDLPKAEESKPRRIDVSLN